MDKRELVDTYKTMLIDFCEKQGRDGLYPYAMGMVDGAVMIGGEPEKIVEKISAILAALKEVNEWR